LNELQRSIAVADYDFGPKYNWDLANLGIRQVLAAVTARLPEDVYSELLDCPSLIVDSSPDVLGRVVDYVAWDHDPPRLVLEGDGPRGQVLVSVVVLDRILAEMPVDLAAGIVAHELAHVYLKHTAWRSGDECEPEADALAASWGFDVVGWKAWLAEAET
jgi:Zn-dependent protease with chaperone function